MAVSLAKRDGTIVKSRIKELNEFTGLGRTKVDRVGSGDICALIGIENFEIGDSICDLENPEPLQPIAIDEPTMSMLFTINNSPFFGKEGKFVTSRHIHDRLIKELDKNLALRVEKSENQDSWIVFGRGVLHLSVLIETMFTNARYLHDLTNQGWCFGDQLVDAICFYFGTGYGIRCTKQDCGNSQQN